MTLPKPTGPYHVSFTDILDKDGTDGTFFRIYYPTAEYSYEDAQFPMWMEEEYLKLLKGYMKELTIFPLSIPVNLPFMVPEVEEKLSIVVFSHGLMLSKDAYSFVCSDVASYGFIVAAVDHKDGSSAGSFYMEKSTDSVTGFVKKNFEHHFIQSGTEEARLERLERVEIRVKELSKVADLLGNLNDGTLSNIFYPDFDLMRFKGKLNLEKMAVMGHSLGGASALVSLLKDDRIKVAITQDPWMYAFDDKYFTQKIAKPIVIINCIGDIKKNDVIKMRQFDCDVTGTAAERLMVTILGTTHFTQTDFAYFSDSFLESLNFKAKNDAELSNKINTELILASLRKHLGLPGLTEITSILEKNKGDVMVGTDIDVSDAEIMEAKKKIMDLILTK